MSPLAPLHSSTEDAPARAAPPQQSGADAAGTRRLQDVPLEPTEPGPTGRTVLAVLGRLSQIGIYPTTLVVILAQAVLLPFFLDTHRARLALNPLGVIGLLLSLLSGPVLIRLVHLACQRRRALLVALDGAIVMLYAMLYAIHVDTKGTCDFALVHDNFHEIFFSETAGLIFAAPALLAIGIAAGLIVAMIVLEWRYRLLSRWERPASYRPRIAGCAALCCVLAVWPPSSHDEIFAFTRSIKAYYLRGDEAASPARVASLGIDPQAPYPYVRASGVDRGGAAGSPQRPHVFVIAMESFNANFVRARTPDGREYTPFFNRLIDRGVFVERFYGNSIQTERGHFSLLCSVVPSIRKKVAIAYPELSLRCLPEVVRAAGYRTVFFTGQGSLAFDRAGEWMPRQGFSRAQAMDREVCADVSPALRWGWGVQDDILYQKVFANLDAADRAQPADDGRGAAPHFVFIATSSNHTRFNEMPADQRYLYPQPTTWREQYANSVHLADRYLAQFFAELDRRPRFRDSLVVLTGDHSFPAGEHDTTWNEFGAYEENFRTPLLLIRAGHLQPRAITDRPFSQLDVAPTVVDLLGIGGETHFLGRSVVAPPDRERVIPLVQPYDGTHLAAVRGYLKLVWHQRSRTESLFDLARDPRETTNVIEAYRGRPELEELRSGLALIRFNQSLLESNRIWPRR